MSFYRITNLSNAKGFCAKVRRWMQRGESSYFHAEQQGDNAVIGKNGERPWGELAGYMTNSTQIENAKQEDAKRY